MTWYVHKESSAIVWAGQYEQPGYTESVADDDAGLLAFLAPKVPASVTNAQLKRQLDAIGKLAPAESAVQSAGGLTLALWYGAGAFNRNDPLLTQMATVIGMSSADVDAAFIAAAKLT